VPGREDTVLSDPGAIAADQGVAETVGVLADDQDPLGGVTLDRLGHVGGHAVGGAPVEWAADAVGNPPHDTREGREQRAHEDQEP
jgi:hypothetical protein